MAASFARCLSLKKQTLYLDANIFTWFKAFSSYGLRFWSHFIYSWWKELGFCRKGASPLRPYQINRFWWVNGWKRISQVETIFSEWRYEDGWVWCSNRQERVKRWDKVQQIKVEISILDRAVMLPNSMHLVPCKHVQIKRSFNSKLTLQDKVMEYA